jgi:hypothetical protein
MDTSLFLDKSLEEIEHMLLQGLALSQEETLNNITQEKTQLTNLLHYSLNESSNREAQSKTIEKIRNAGLLYQQPETPNKIVEEAGKTATLITEHPAILRETLKYLITGKKI